MATPQYLNEFTEYHSKPLSKDRLQYLNNLNAVEYEHVELYRDFIVSLAYLIGDTYLGDNIHLDEVDRVGHFDWCWKKNLSNFELENLKFLDSGEHYYYFIKYFTDYYYLVSDKQSSLINRIILFWENIMTVDRLKTNSEYDLFINLYKIQKKNFYTF